MKKFVRPREKPKEPRVEPRAILNWKAAIRRFQVVKPEQAGRHANDPMRAIEAHQAILLEKVVFPAIARILSEQGDADVVYIGERDFDLPVTYDGVTPVITPEMLEVVRRRYTCDSEGGPQERDHDPLDKLAVAISQIEPSTTRKSWEVTIHRHLQVYIDGLAKDCCLEFR